MFNSTYNISIPEPCHENWQTMTVSEKGKFCNACQKNVHDFTKASDKQIIDAFNIDKNLCGRFLDSQLERDIFETKEKSSFWLATTSTILSFLALGNENVSAQEKARIEQIENKIISNDNIEYNSERIISGVVSDSLGPLQNVQVKVLNTNIFTSSDSNGKYNIKAMNGQTLEFITDKNVTTNKQYASIVHINNINNASNLDVLIDYRLQMLTGTVGGACMIRQSFIRRTFNKIKNLFK